MAYSSDIVKIDTIGIYFSASKVEHIAAFFAGSAVRILIRRAINVHSEGRENALIIEQHMSTHTFLAQSIAGVIHVTSDILGKANFIFEEVAGLALYTLSLVIIAMAVVRLLDTDSAAGEHIAVKTTVTLAIRLIEILTLLSGVKCLAISFLSYKISRRTSLACQRVFSEFDAKRIYLVGPLLIINIAIAGLQ